MDYKLVLPDEQQMDNSDIIGLYFWVREDGSSVEKGADGNPNPVTPKELLI